MRNVSKTTQALLLDRKSKAEGLRSKYDELRNGLEAEMHSLISKFNSDNGEAIRALEIEYQATAEEVMNIADDLHTKSQEYMDDRSDRWHGSDAGYEYNQWSEEWLDLHNSMHDLLCFNFEVSVDITRIPEIDLPNFKP